MTHGNAQQSTTAMTQQSVAQDLSLFPLCLGLGDDACSLLQPLLQINVCLLFVHKSVDNFLKLQIMTTTMNFYKPKLLFLQIDTHVSQS